jgi:beta-lactamase regulating signal transducer with metallopeptidase domain
VHADAPRRGGRLYRLQLALGAAGLGACALGLAAGVSSVHVEPAAAHRLDVAGARLTYPAVNVAAVVVLALAALGAAVMVVTLRAAWRQVRAHRRLMGALPVAGTLPGHPTVRVIQAAAPMAFCAGWVRPRVHVSTAALERLSDRELRAVLAHEQHHGALRDPLRLAVSRVLCQALFFLPVLRSLHDRYTDVSELTADAAALEATDGATAPLASAMLAFGATRSGDVVGISPERVDALLGRPHAWQLPRTLLIAALVAIAVLVALVWRASGSASVQASLNLPIASSQPCVLVLALVPVLVCLAGAVGRPALATGRRVPTGA